MYSFLIIIHLLVCIILTVVILLQSSKGGGLAGVFGGGGGGMGAVFGGRGAASFLSKLTTALAILFMVVSLILGFITKSGTGSGSIVGEERAKGNISSPANDLPTVPTEGITGGETVPIPVEPSEGESNPSEDQTNQ